MNPYVNRGKGLGNISFRVKRTSVSEEEESGGFRVERSSREEGLG